MVDLNIGTFRGWLESFFGGGWKIVLECCGNMDPRELKPIELVRLVNSTPLGEVLDDRTLRAHRNAAGFRIGDGKRVNFFRYMAWLFDRVHQRVSPAATGESSGADGYDAHRARAHERQLELSREGRDIGPIPPVHDPARRKACEFDFKTFCETYFSDAFYLGWSKDHLRVIARIEAVVLRNELFAEAMPRGFGKTSIARTAALWATLFGHHDYVMVVAANDTKVTQLIDAIKITLTTNAQLMSDFPEVCYPIKKLENIPNRAAGQLCEGQPTRIGWGAKRLVFPTIPGSPASGRVFQGAGIESGDILGAQFARSDGVVVRPTLAIIDDPQTPETAASPASTDKRLKIITRSILGLAGPARKIAAIMPCTVIAQGDLADELTDRTKHPEWHGERSKFMKSFPKNLEMWEQYWQIRRAELMNDGDLSESNRFYRRNRVKMDEGAHVSWEDRYDRTTEISAIQAAMNAYLEDPSYFFAEMQNEPLSDVGDARPVTPDDVYRKLNRRKKHAVPTACNIVTAFVDVQDNLLYWVIAAWEANLTGYVLDYGVFPQQGIEYFTARNAKHILANRYPGKGKKACWYAGFNEVVNSLCSIKFPRDDGVELSISRLLIDASDGEASSVVYQFCKESPYRAILLPFRGYGVTASSRPFEDFTTYRGHRVGFHWRVQPTRRDPSVRYLLSDVNFWKSHVRDGWKTGQGDAGSISIFGSKHQLHRLFADHCAAEYPVKTQGRGRTLEEWKLRRTRPDNHWFDCLVGACAAASEQGCALDSTGPAILRSRRRKRKYVRLSDMRRGRK